MVKMKKLKVFFGLVNYGTQAGILSEALRSLGIEAFSASYPDKYKRQIDFEFFFGGNLLHKAYKHFLNFVLRLYWFFHYNTFHFFYGTSLFPNNFDLPLYRIFGKKVVMQYLGSDIMDFEIAVLKYDFPVQHRFVKEKHLRQDSRIIRLTRDIQYSDIQIVIAPIYQEFLPSAYLLPLAVDLQQFQYAKKKPGNTIRILHAPTDKLFKGTDLIQKSIDELISEGYAIEFEIAENLSHDELKQKYIECDLFIDQLLSGWYGTASIEAMAIGRPVLCFLDKTLLRKFEYSKLLPIINVTCNNLSFILKDLYSKKSEFDHIGISSRKYVEVVHNSEIIAKKLNNMYRYIP